MIIFYIFIFSTVNWADHWFEYFPNPPINILGMIENVLAYHDKYLLQHFVKYSVTSQVSVFSKVIMKLSIIKVILAKPSIIEFNLVKSFR